MRAVIQRVLESSVSVDGKVVGQSGKGYMILLGVVKGDTEKEGASCKKNCSFASFRG
jgi:D-tyrosyl-tRNA(Tyr) deacylase